MSCNCNTANPNCEPCAICTPPGVTGLTTCVPLDPCDGQSVDIRCVTYTGQDFPCIDVQNGDDLISVLLNILYTYFPPEYCCGLEGEIDYSDCGLAGTVGYYTTTTTTTAAPTTTTTTLIPFECSFYQINNVGPRFPGATVQYIPCNCLIPNQIFVSDAPVTVCVNNSFPISVISGTVSVSILGPCDAEPCPTTTTTTVTPCECLVYTVQNTSTNPITIYFTECNNGYSSAEVTIAGETTIEVCACSDILDNTDKKLIISTASVSCTSNPTTSTTTSTTTTSTTTTTTIAPTTTTTTVIPVCKCYSLYNPTAGTLNYQFGECIKNTIEFSAVSPGYTEYRCSYDVYLVPAAGLVVTELGDCEEVDCVSPSTTTTTTYSCTQYSLTNLTATNKNYTYTNCSGQLIVGGFVLPYSCITINAVTGSVIAASGLTVAEGECTTTTTTTSSETTTTEAPTTTTTTVGFLFGRRATIPVPVDPNPGLVIAYFDTNGDPQTLSIPAQESASNYYLCIECGTTISILSGTPPGSITYDDLGPVDCNCII